MPHLGEHCGELLHAFRQGPRRIAERRRLDEALERGDKPRVVLAKRTTPATATTNPPLRQRASAEILLTAINRRTGEPIVPVEMSRPGQRTRLEGVAEGEQYGPCKKVASSRPHFQQFVVLIGTDGVSKWRGLCTVQKNSCNANVEPGGLAGLSERSFHTACDRLGLANRRSFCREFVLSAFRLRCSGIRSHRNWPVKI
jgi:hypothetical protein